MIEVCNYIYHNYPEFRDLYAKWEILSFLDRNERNVLTINEGNKIKGVALFFSLTDEALKKIRTGDLDLNKPEDIKEAKREKGDNIYITLVLAQGYKTIKKGIKKLFKKAKRVCWHEPDMSRLHIYKRR